MNTWLWGEKYPDYMDALVPMAAQPSEMASRNRMLRRMLLDTVRNDPSYENGNYTAQPRSLKIASTLFNIATAGGTLHHEAIARTADKADQYVNALLAASFTADENDSVYQWASSRDYNPSPDLEKILAPALVIDSADDARNPLETGIMERELRRVRDSHFYLIPASAATTGHLTVIDAKFYGQAARRLS
jgi:homoserine O-acetyltransferase/O-succinyltransferase